VQRVQQDQQALLELLDKLVILDPQVRKVFLEIQEQQALQAQQVRQDRREQIPQ
jgi:hypothetical protein